jgi:hypothetical protein
MEFICLKLIENSDKIESYFTKIRTTSGKA